MGIRYLAVSISEADFNRLSSEPPAMLIELEDDGARDGLDLDKSWAHLQRYLEESGPRAAGELVAGDVTHTSDGWIPYRGLVSPERVRAAAADLATITQPLLQAFFGVSETEGTSRDMEDYCYVSEYLRRAVEFIAEVALEKRAIVYWIG